MEHRMTERTYLPPREALAQTIADFKDRPYLRIRGNFALNAHGRPVSPHAPDATCFCAIGRYVYHRGPTDMADGSFGILLAGELPITFNSEVWGPNDDDASPEGTKAIAALERILAKMEAPAA